MKYKCIKDFCIDKCDDDGFYTGKQCFINNGTIWESDSTASYIGGEIHLDRIFKSKKAKTMQWLEIPKEKLEECFELLESE